MKHSNTFVTAMFLTLIAAIVAISGLFILIPDEDASAFSGGYPAPATQTPFGYPAPATKTTTPTPPPTNCAPGECVGPTATPHSEDPCLEPPLPDLVPWWCQTPDAGFGSGGDIMATEMALMELTPTPPPHQPTVLENIFNKIVSFFRRIFTPKQSGGKVTNP